jgi:predicted aspartyl protease
MKRYFRNRMGGILWLVTIWSLASVVCAQQTGWQRHQVEWRMTGGTRIQAVHYPHEKPPPMLASRGTGLSKVTRKNIPSAQAAHRFGKQSLLVQQEAAPVMALVMDSPPLDGFVPWVAVIATNEKSFDDFDGVAVPKTSPIGFLTANPETDYAIGIFDTGAATFIMGKSPADQMGLDNSYLTSSTVEIGGVVGTVTAWVSKPFGIYIDGLGAINPANLQLNTSGLIGETNVSIAIGMGSVPELPTVVGAPMSVYFAAHFRNTQILTLTRDSGEYTAPDIRFYDPDDNDIPVYPNYIPLELRPLGGIRVEFVPDIFGMDLGSPSVVSGGLVSQSMFFVHSVDLVDGAKSAIDKDRFLFDTGAQVTVVGSRVGARLGLNPAAAEFMVEIQGVSGGTVMRPGFYLDSLEIPALGDWLSFSNIPVVLMDISSPEGGTLDGIIGMNLFVDLNFVLRGGGLFGQADPAIEYQIILKGDVAPGDGDGLVNVLDLSALAWAWLTTQASGNWNSKCDIAPVGSPDGVINILDFALFASYWQQGVH